MPDFNVCAAVREKRPLVHCISNIVTANDCANILYAFGASPMMAEACEEMAEISALADAAVLNTGTPSDARYEAARICLEESRRLEKPVVLDPVGVGASSWRLERVLRLLESGAPDILRVNLAEAEALLGLGSAELGVDSPGRTDRAARASAAKLLSRQLGCVVLLTGEFDAVSDGERCAVVSGGSALMPLITGSGCMLSAVCGAFAAVEDAFSAALDASLQWKRCSELAEQACAGRGPGSLRAALMDTAHVLWHPLTPPAAQPEWL